MTHDQTTSEFSKRPARKRRKKSGLAKAPAIVPAPSTQGGPAVSVFEIPVGDTGRVVESAFRFGV